MSEATAREFAEKGYVRANGVMSEALRKNIYNFALRRSAEDNGCIDRDSLLAGTNIPSFYAEPRMEGLLEAMRPVMEEITGVKLYPTYSFFRVYREGDLLPRHTDRDACEISVTLNLGSSSDGDWPIFMQKGDGEPTPIALQPGDGAIYRGCIVDHWREELGSGHHAQAFLHYVERGGPCDAYKYDRRWAIGLLASHTRFNNRWEKLLNRTRVVPAKLWSYVLHVLQMFGRRAPVGS